jgi:hypothetical protein
VLEEEGHQEERLAAFYDCISNYTLRKLTKRDDKLPALSGLASAFQSPKLGAYLAGLWEMDLLYGLNWRPYSSEKQKDPGQGEKNIAPSWSWAPMPGRCKVGNIRTRITGKSDWEAQFKQFSSTLTPQLLSHHIELATSDPYGRISATTITLRGFTRQ